MPRLRPALLVLLLASALPGSAAWGAACTDEAAPRCEDPRRPGPATSLAVPRVVEISLGRAGFAPSEVTVPRGVPVRFVITRSDGAACASGLRIPALGVEAQVPRGRPVDVLVTPAVTGVFPVTCVGEGVAGLLIVG